LHGGTAQSICHAFHDGERALRSPYLEVFEISMLVVTSRERLLTFILSMVHPQHRPEIR